jgi:type I restriction enzyme M protein
MSTLSHTLTPAEVLERIFRDPSVAHGLAEFQDLPQRPEKILTVFPKTATNGKTKGQTRYYVKCLKRGIDIQVLAATKANPEEIVRQLWLHKLTDVYKYPLDHVSVEHAVTFGTGVSEKAADIVVWQKDGETAKVVIECKEPNRKDGIEQLKSYLNAEGSPVGVWSNGSERIILYRPYPHEFEDTLTEIPAYGQEPADVLREKLSLDDLRVEFDFKRIIQDLEELVLANAGVDEFNEIFKIIFAKLYDEMQATDRADEEVEFRKSEDPARTYATVQFLFESAMYEWPGIFDDGEQIKLTPHHLQVVVGPIERIRLLGANMRVMDDAFEYLMPNVAKKKNGQFFTPRYVIDMCVKMLAPKRKEYVIDPACGSAGFLVHTMEIVMPAAAASEKARRKYEYAARYVWGIDFDERSTKVARALMLIAGDGRSHVFRANSLDPREWFTSNEGESMRAALRGENLLAKKPSASKVVDAAEAWEYFRDLKFDVVLTNPPFAGEIRDKELLRRYTLAERALAKKRSKEERDVLFIERCVQIVKPGGRIAIVLPQGKVNNATLGYIRDWLIARARLLAVVSLHANTFKPHTGTKTSVLFLQKYTESQLREISAARAAAEGNAPNYASLLREIVEASEGEEDLPIEELPLEVVEILDEDFPAPEPPAMAEEGESEPSDDDERLPGETEAVDDPVERLKAEIERCERSLESLTASLASAAETDGKREAKRLRRDIRAAEKKLDAATSNLKLWSLRGRVELLLADEDAMERLKERWISTAATTALSYPVFFATSERGGKRTNGDYIYRRSADGTLLEDRAGNPLVDQDLVRYRDEDPEGVAERFVEWGEAEGLDFLS